MCCATVNGERQNAMETLDTVVVAGYTVGGQGFFAWGAPEQADLSKVVSKLNAKAERKACKAAVKAAAKADKAMAKEAAKLAKAEAMQAALNASLAAIGAVMGCKLAVSVEGGAA